MRAHGSPLGQEAIDAAKDLTARAFDRSDNISNKTFALAELAQSTGEAVYIDRLAAMEPAILGNVADIKFVYFKPEDVVRHKLVKSILYAFDQYHARHNGKAEDGVGESLAPHGLEGVPGGDDFTRPDADAEHETAPEKGPSL